MLVQRHSSWQCAITQYSTARVGQRAPVAAASKAGREWGSGWGRKKGENRVKQTANSSLLQQQQQPISQPNQQQQLGVQQQKSATVKDYAAAYDAIADAIHQAFASKKIYGCCLPASLLFYEAVKAVNPAAYPQFVLGHVVTMMPPGGSKTSVRHLWVELGSRQYDIGRRVAAALVLKEHGPEGLSQHRLLTHVGLERPPGAAYFGWNQGEDSVVPVVSTEQLDAALLKQFQCEPGRRLYCAAAPKDVLAIRDDILSRNLLNSDKGLNGL